MDPAYLLRQEEKKVLVGSTNGGAGGGKHVSSTNYDSAVIGISISARPPPVLASLRCGAAASVRWN